MNPISDQQFENPARSDTRLLLADLPEKLFEKRYTHTSLLLRKQHDMQNCQLAVKSASRGLKC